MIHTSYTKRITQGCKSKNSNKRQPTIDWSVAIPSRQKHASKQILSSYITPKQNIHHNITNFFTTERQTPHTYFDQHIFCYSSVCISRSFVCTQGKNVNHCYSIINCIYLQHSNISPLFVGQQSPLNPKLAHFSFSEHLPPSAIVFDASSPSSIHDSSCLMLISSPLPFGGP